MMPEHAFSVEVSGSGIARIELRADQLFIKIHQRDRRETIQSLEITCSREEDGTLTVTAEEWRNPENRISVRTRIERLGARQDGNGDGNGQSHDGSDS